MSQNKLKAKKRKLQSYKDIEIYSDMRIREFLAVDKISSSLQKKLRFRKVI